MVKTQRENAGMQHLQRRCLLVPKSEMYLLASEAECRINNVAKPLNL